MGYAGGAKWKPADGGEAETDWTARIDAGAASVLRCGTRVYASFVVRFARRRLLLLEPAPEPIFHPFGKTTGPSLPALATRTALRATRARRTGGTRRTG